MTTDIGNNAATGLKSYVERVGNLENDKREIAEDIRSVLKEAKDAGFDTKAIKAIVKRQRENAEDRAKREVHEEVLESYLSALGALADTPLGRAAVKHKQREESHGKAG